MSLTRHPTFLRVKIKETFRKCQQCLKRLPKGSDGIHLGWSVQDGPMYLCSERCVDSYNTRDMR